MSDYTLTTKQVREQFTREEPPQIGTVTEKGRAFDRWLEQVKAEAWDEGHQTPQERGPDGCECHARHEGECACGLFGTGDILTPNPYRKETGR